MTVVKAATRTAAQPLEIADSGITVEIVGGAAFPARQPGDIIRVTVRHTFVPTAATFFPGLGGLTLIGRSETMVEWTDA